jgi:hypothetical protein
MWLAIAELRPELGAVRAGMVMEMARQDIALGVSSRTAAAIVAMIGEWQGGGWPG